MLTVMFAGQVTVGGWASRTVTVKVQLLRLVQASVAVQTTAFTPRGKVEPLGGLHASVTAEQLSVALAV